MADHGTPARVLVAASAAALGAIVPIARPAAAESPALLQCQGAETVTYRPGVLLRPRNIEITTAGRFGSCAGGAVTSGAYAERFTIFAGCGDLLDGFHARRTFRWNTGDASVLDATGSSTAVAGQVITTITGRIIRGRFTGRTAVQTVTLPQPSALRCLTTGLTNATGVTTLSVA
ncbi:hypothetical protein [Actinoallomurus rhizosphaericola]|uniref:hypothetical protein n=1 Tax=Actinoallomurus rhizosphaericola TaxID=2952536 RepID=UPI002093341E|nr:hypothetical protein [Actinoallomurus rhizosphaericola]MCO5999280.1 hypothetical protein [Actinoallomurus rhizosphaericola]